MKEAFARRTMSALRWLVAVPLALSSCTVILPLLVPPGFAGWVFECVIEPYAPFLGTWRDWPWAVRILYLVFWYAYFIVDVILVFAAKRLWTFLIYWSVLVASTCASLYILNDALALPDPY